MDSRNLYPVRRYQCSPYDPSWHHRRAVWRQSYQEQSSTDSITRECNRRLKCTINLIVSLFLCLGGTIWQLSSIGGEYFSYAVVSEVSLVKVYDIEPPAVSICLPYVEMIGLERLNLTQINDSEATSQIIQETYTISDLFSLTPEIEKLIVVCWIRRQESYDIDFDLSKFQIKKFIRDSFVCYRFSHINQEQPGFIYRSHHIQYGRRRGGLMSVRMNKTFFASLKINRFIIYLHPYEMYPQGDRDYALHLIAEENVFAEKDTIWAISWTKVTQTLLKPPYSTNCADNQRFGYENKEHCQHKCVAEQSIKKYGKSSFTLSQDEPSRYTVLSQTSLRRNRSLEREVDGWIEGCNSTCWGHNCIRVNYCPLVTSTLEHEKYIGFQIFDQNGPETRIAFIEKLTLVNFLVYILSIVGVWLGISCLDISKNIIHFLAKVQAVKLSISHCKGKFAEETEDERGGIEGNTNRRVNVFVDTASNDGIFVRRSVKNQFDYPGPRALAQRRACAN